MNTMMRAMAARSNSDGTMGALNPTLAQLGYFEDARGNIYYPDGLIMSGPDVDALSRSRATRGAIPITVNNTPQQLVTLANGQQMPAAQFQQLSAQQQQQLLTGGVSATGLQIGSTNISWTLIIVVGLGIVLLQSKPLSRS